MINQDTFPSITYSLGTPEGKAIIIFMEDYKGKLIKVTFMVGKSGIALRAYCEAISQLINLSLESGASPFQILQHISNITSDRSTRMASGMYCRSAVEALGIALKSYLADKANHGVTHQRASRVG